MRILRERLERIYDRFGGERTWRLLQRRDAASAAKIHPHDRVINLLEGYGNDNPGAKSQGMKQLMAGGGVALIGITLVPLLTGLFG